MQYFFQAAWRVRSLVILLALVLGVDSALPATAAPAAPPALPSLFYGRVTIDGAPAPVSASVTASIADVEYAATVTVLDNGIVVYQIEVPGDDPLTEQREGGQDGEMVVFQVNGLVTLPTAIWSQGGVTRLDLLASTAPPPAISYTLAQQLNTLDPVALGAPISFTVQITNTGATVITSLPLTDTFDSHYLTFVQAEPAPDYTSATGQLNWNNVVASCAGALHPQTSCTVVITFQARRDTSLLVDGATINTVQSGDLVSSVGVQLRAVVPLTLAEQSVVVVAGQVHISWRTVDEGQVVGFFLVRQAGQSDGVRLHSTMIPAQHAGEALGAAYQYIDATSDPGQPYHYLLEVINRNGESSYLHLGSINQQIFLPWLVSRSACCQYTFLPVLQRAAR